jgi:predicted 2-oxoglutarate/Fe(II)-dependent dioxygenase YbiX
MTISLRLPDHPRAAELIALAKERDEGSRVKLLDLLGELGLPHDTFKAAGGETILPPKDQVIIGDRVCSYEFTGNVVEIRGAITIDLATRLVAQAERLAGWNSSTQIGADGSSYRNEHRTSKAQRITEGSFTELASSLREALWECARFYRCWNPHALFTSDADWEILKYEPGESFSKHVDAIANTRWQRRQLAAIVYLNDDFEGGGTMFHRPGPVVTIKPEQGKVILFPPFYTHPHEGLPVTTGTKYVALGWFYP